MIVAAALMASHSFGAEPVRVEGKNIRVEFNAAMHSRVVASSEDRSASLANSRLRSPFAYRATRLRLLVAEAVSRTRS